ncbi:MAG: LacI family DNA-binding transcriptional regulator [Lachnospiraceae bacterium]
MYSRKERVAFIMTIKDIAELSGFSKSTVSRVLNNSPKVDKKPVKLF